MFKNILKFLVLLLPWFISGVIFKVDVSYYKMLHLPVFAPASFIFPIVWTILYILIAISVYKVIDKANNDYKICLIINYFSNQLYTFCFFTLKSNFLGLADSLIVFVSSMYLYIETKNINNKASYYLILYIIWNLFATILSFVIFLLN